MTPAGWLAIGVLWIVVIVLGVAVLALARQVGVLHQRLQPVGALTLAKGLTVGQPAPEVPVTDLRGREFTIGARNPSGLDTLLVFVSPTCPVCKSLLPALRAMRRHERARVEIVLASDGARAEQLAFVAAEALQEFSYVLSEPLGLAYAAGRLPHAVLLDSAGVVRATGLVNSREQLDSLFEAHERGVASLQDYLASHRARDVA